MILKQVIGLVFTGVLACSVNYADVVIRVRPPHPQYERRSAAPGRDYVWIAGYHRWDGNAYLWAPGRWDRRPRAHARWVAARWRHQRGGWVMVEGHWR